MRSIGAFSISRSIRSERQGKKVSVVRAYTWIIDNFSDLIITHVFLKVKRFGLKESENFLKQNFKLKEIRKRKKKEK